MLRGRATVLSAEPGAFIRHGRRCYRDNLEQVQRCVDRPGLTNFIPDGSMPTMTGQPLSSSSPETHTVTHIYGTILLGHATRML